MHPTKEACNTIPGLENLDLIWPLSAHGILDVDDAVIYEISKILVPGIPKDMIDLTIDQNRISDPKSTALHWFLSHSVSSPLISGWRFVSKWIQTVKGAVPDNLNTLEYRPSSLIDGSGGKDKREEKQALLLGNERE